jgi:SAM-dependent methyltransferase
LLCERVVRSDQLELLDSHDLPDPVVARAYRDLTRLHRFLGNTRTLARAIRRDPRPVRRVLDVGCANGDMLAEIRDRLGVEAIGVDLHPLRGAVVPVVRADAIRDPLPAADVAFSVCLGHHLSEDELVALIGNVGRSCRRFILMDLVRHPIPLGLFRWCVAPFFSPIAAADGALSIRRAYTPSELARIAERAGVQFRHFVAPLYIRQTLDIRYSDPPPPLRGGSLLH